MSAQLLRLGSLCSGIGALDLGLEYGLHARTLWQVEADAYCRRVLARHWDSGTERFDDVRTAGAATLVPVDALCAGFPCQPVSVAGKRKAQEDSRWLWPEVARIVGELRPAICIFENVLGLRTSGMRDVLRDLAALGFDAEWSDISAWEVGAPHIRRRIFIVATDPKRVQLREQPGWLCRAFESARAPIPRNVVEALSLADPDSERFQGPRQAQDEATGGHDTAERARSQRHTADALRERRDASGCAQEPNGQHPRLPASADHDGLRRLEQSWSLSTERGWPVHRGWRFDSTPRVDDVPTRGLVGAMRKAAGNAVVTACAFVVGAATRRAVSFQEAA